MSIKIVKSKYIYYIILFIYICVFLIFSLYDNICEINDSSIIVDGNVLKLNEGILDDRYISKEDLLKNFPNNVFYDKIARKLIVLTWDDILKLGNESVREHNNMLWYDINEIVKYFGLTAIQDQRSHSIYIYNGNEINAQVIKSRTEVYDEHHLDVIGIVDGNEKMYSDDFKYLTVKISTDKNGWYIGLVEKTDLKYEVEKIEKNENDNDKMIITTVVNKLQNGTNLSKVTDLAYEMLRINSENDILEETYLLNKGLKQNVYAVITNGYKSASFDPDVLSRLVTSDTNKEEVANKIIEYLEKYNLEGLVIDFKNFKIADKERLTQYIKELAALLHKNNKSIIIKMNNLTQYNIDSIKGFVNHIVIEAHSFRTAASRISASHSSIFDVERMLQQFIMKVDTDKLIVEFSPYSILWTEKDGFVINAEMYSMEACEKYIKSNNLKSVFDTVASQKLIDYKKGVINYKMWIEDKESIQAKVQLAKNMGLTNFAIYRSGYENKELYNALEF